MNLDFKTRLLEFLFDEAGGHSLQRGSPRPDYGKLLAFGSYAESGEYYYLFIYRDSFERANKFKYGAVVFLYKPFNLETPIHITCTDSGLDWNRRNIYIQAAVYFLKNQYQNTLALEGAVKEFYEKLKPAIEEHSREESENTAKYQTLNFNVLQQEIEFQEFKPTKSAENRCSPHIANKLKLLKPVKLPGLGQEPGMEVTGTTKARMGLCLVLDQHTPGRIRFKPVIVPYKRDGTLGAAKPAPRSLMEKYEFQETPEFLSEFTNHLHELSRKVQRDSSRLDILSQVYFPHLSRLLVEMPDGLTFYQSSASDQLFYPLKKIKFKKLEVQFAPAWNREKLRILLALTGKDDQRIELGTEVEIILEGEDQVCLFFFAPGNIPYFAVPGESKKYYRFFHFFTQVKEFHFYEFKTVLAGLQEVASDALAIHPEPLSLYQLEFHPTPVLKILERDPFRGKPERLEVEFDYHPGITKFFARNPQVGHHLSVHCERDKTFEAMCLYLLKNDPLLNLELKQDLWQEKTTGFYFTFTDGDDLRWLIESSGQYLEKGFRIYSFRRQQYIGKTGGKLRIDLNPDINWLEFRPLLENAATGETVEIEEIDFENHTITDQRGTLHVVDQEDIEKLKRLSRFAQRHGKVYRVPSQNYFLINSLYDQRMENLPSIKDKLLSAHELKKLESFKKIPTYRLSRHFNGQLRNYQRAGFKWLHFLQEYHLSGCLADDMGLGKTVQTLALLQTLKDENQLKTSLLVVPVSAVPNWEMEIQRFTPGLTYYIYLGVAREKDISRWENYDLLVTSYATLRNDIEIFKNYEFDYIVLDESQNIKNLNSQVSKAVKILKGRHRLALSGTPIENTSLELWSLFDFLMPGFLGTHEWFRREWALPVEKYQDEEKTGILKQMLYPFILRRKKEEVEKDLPAKIEVVETLEMEEEQSKVYVETARYYTEILSRAIDEKGIGKSAFKILEGMLRLRQICLFPQLADVKYEGAPSVKFDHFIEMLEDILAEGHKVLVFSQFVKILAIIRNHLDQENIRYSYIDGSVEAGARGKTINDFQGDKGIGVFLLSLKAGGVALNLTAADYVIIFDPWWNPAVETQAIDRSHRIGQTKKVFVYRLVVKNTIEEKMLKLQEQKKDLVEKLITSEPDAFKNLSRDDVLNLFRFS